MKKLGFIAILLVILLTSSFSAAFAVPVDKVPVIVGFKGLPDAALVHAFGGDITYQYSIIPAIACSMSPHAIEALKNNPNVEYVQYEVEYQATEYNSGGIQDWGVIKINAATIHPDNTGTGVKVAVVDTGINRLHADLKANFRGGWDFVNNDNDPNDDNGHGSHCAGIIAAAHNTIAVVGVAPDVSIYSYKALNSRGSGYTSWIAAGIDRAVLDGCQIISMSLGSRTSDPTLQAACARAYDSGVVVVAAAGNDGATSLSYPAAYPGVISVGATDIDNQLASFSNTGSGLDFVAPGVAILSDYRDINTRDSLNQDVVFMSGTSMACPHVAGATALLLATDEKQWEGTSKDGKWTPDEVQSVLALKSIDLGDVGYDPRYGYGIVDVLAFTELAPTATKDYQPTAITPLKGTISGTVVNLYANDGSALTVKSAKIASTKQALEWTATTTITKPETSLIVTFDGRYSTTATTQTIFALDKTTTPATYVPIDSRSVGTTDSKITISSLDLSKYVGADGSITLKIYAEKATTKTFTGYADQALFTISYPN